MKKQRKTKEVAKSQVTPATSQKAVFENALWYHTFMVKLSKHNQQNEGTKKEYEKHLLTLKKDKVKQSTANAKIRSVCLFESVNNFADFNTFDNQQGELFYTHLRSLDIEPATRINHLVNVKDFLYWHFQNTKVKNKTQKLNALETLEPTLVDKRLANRSEIVEFPTDEEIKKILALPIETVKDKRDRALIVFLIITACRISAAATTTLKLVDLEKHIFRQDPLEGVHTKFDNYIITQFLEFSPEYYAIISDWIETLRLRFNFNDDCPLFPKITEYAGHTEVQKTFLGDATAYNKLITSILNKAGVRKYHPHAFRHYAIFTALDYVRNGVQLKALSQNVGHAELVTILEQYANIRPERYTKIIQNMLSCKRDLSSFSDDELLKELINRQKINITF